MASQSSFHTWKEEPPSTSGVVLKKECLDKLPAVDLGQCIPYSQSGGEETVPLNIYSASSMEQLASIYRNQMESQGGFGTGSRGVSGHVAEMIEAGIGYGNYFVLRSMFSFALIISFNKQGSCETIDSTNIRTSFAIEAD